MNMDETHEQSGSNAVLTDFDCDTLLKGTADDVGKELAENNCDASNNDVEIETLNSNGADKESEAQASNNFITNDVESTQSQESAVDKITISSVNLHDDTDTKCSASGEEFVHSLKECIDNKTENEFTSGFANSGRSESNEENFNKSDESGCEESKKEDASLEKIMDISENQLTEVCESDKECKKPDCSENYEFNENNNTVKSDQQVFLDKKSENIEVENEKEIITPVSEKCFENEPHDSFEESSVHTAEISCLEESVNETGTLSPSNKINNEIEIDKLSEETDNQKPYEDVNIKDGEMPSSEIANENTETNHTNNQQSEEGEDNDKVNELGSLFLSAELNKAEEISQENQSDEKSKNDLDTECELQSQTQTDNKEVEANQETTTFALEVNSSNEITYASEEKKSDETDDSENSQQQLEMVSTESEKDWGQKESEKEAGNNNKSVQDLCNSQSIAGNLSTIFEQEEENINKSENDGNEIMDTEMVNCNEIEQIDLSENETDLKGESRDEEIMSDSLETVGEKNNEDHISNGREDSREIEKRAMLMDEAINQPGSSEEETITGDMINQPSAELTKEKDEEVCIIPDDVIPVLSILPQNKGSVGVREENGSLKVLKVTPPELIKPKTRAQDKRGQAADSKPRPVRNAAKLAGNKIKSLVESDLVFDDQTLRDDLEEENYIHENTDESAQMCAQCRELKVCKLLSVQNDITQYLCSEQCSVAFKAAHMDVDSTETDSTLREYLRKCSQCHSQITADENRLFWETMDFCNEDCLGKYQLELGSTCANCKKTVPSTSLGKYCVRFGYDIRQFCSAMCLEEYKKGLKVCSYCQKDISTGAEGFLAPVGTKGQFKDFCTQSCMEKYDRMSSNKPLPETVEECAVCSNSKPVQVEVELENKTHKLCSEPCFAAFKFVNNITEGQCDMCRKYFDRAKISNYSLRLLFYDETLHSFCSKTCMNVYILANRKIVPCNWCKVKKYNFDMIKKVSPDGQLSKMCSLNCLMLYQTSVNAVCSRPIKCDFCKKKFVRQPLYHLTMSDSTLRNFCSYNCVISFQNGYPKQKSDIISGPDQLNSPIPTGAPKRITPKRSQMESTCVPVISSVQSLASPNGPVSPPGRVQISRGDVNVVPQVSQPLSVPSSPVPAPPPPQIYQQIITKPAPAKQMKNKSVLCKPYSHTKGVSCRPHPCMKETQTDQSLNRKFLIPIPVPIYVPAPMHMFATPFPVPVPFPLPIPVPIFIPTTRNSAKGIMKEIKKIQEKIPTDPFEAELLMMAEMVAGDKKQDPTDSESEDGNDGDDNGDGTFSPENVDTSNTFGDDMLQMALKMASELEEPAVDMESVLTSNTITTSTQPAVDPNKALYASDTDDPDQVNVMAMNRGRKRSVRGSRNSSGGTPSKRGRRTSGSVDVPLLPPPEPVPPRTIEVEKPDANMCLKYTFGVNAWRHWVMQKNAELEKVALTNRKIKLFKPELLQLTADELNFSLCLFVKEVRKPNGTEYAPDTIYYLCLGIQQYLFENGRIDNIFTDSYYEKFTDCLDEVAKKFAALYNDSQFIVTRVEEEHLWESKQLGAHSPHVLLSTLMFFNTKHFNLVTVEEHMQLSFSHIMKHWKRNPNTPGVAKVPGSRNVLLRFYPPQSALEANSRKKKVYEQQENEENPLRCPVKLYEFYLSKCPESVKTRNDVFYLLPERSCVPDSPVWYSTMALGKEPLMKMLHRIKMVKEINIALLTS